MRSEFRTKLKTMMDEYRKKNLTFDEVFKNAPYRQLMLISTCFDVCVGTYCENIHALDDVVYEDLIEKGILIEGNNSLTTIKAKDFYPIDKKIANLPESEMKNLRKNMTDFLKDKCDVIVIIDGNVKSKERSAEKAKDTIDESVMSLNDINRLTIASPNLFLLDAFSKNLYAKVGDNNICAKDKWEMKSFGMLSKSNYIFIDGFPAEIHLNDPRQMMLSKVMTHLVYEAIRVDTMTDEGCDNFNKLYSELPLKVNESLQNNSNAINDKDFAILGGLNIELARIVKESSKLTIIEKNDQLLDFHRKCHKMFYDSSSPEWKNVYSEANTEYNNKRNVKKSEVSKSDLDNKRFKL